MQVQINGELREFEEPQSVHSIVTDLGLDPRKIAVERNLEIVPRSAYDQTTVGAGDRLEIVHFIGGGADPAPAAADDDTWEVAGRRFRSRLIVGTGKYRDFEQTAAALDASGAEIITVAVRRVNVTDPNAPMLIDYVDPKRYTYLPNTAGCFTGEDAVRTLRLAREAGGWSLVKLEVLGDQETLYPNMPETLRARRDPDQGRLRGHGLLQRRPDHGQAAGGHGLRRDHAARGAHRLRARRAEPGRHPHHRRAHRRAGAGRCRCGDGSDAAVAMELGCDGVLMNTAIAGARDPVLMAHAMRHAVEAGRLAYLAGRMAKKRYADPSSPLGGLI